MTGAFRVSWQSSLSSLSTLAKNVSVMARSLGLVSLVKELSTETVFFEKLNALGSGLCHIRSSHVDGWNDPKRRAPLGPVS